jgi:serine/threonine protein kinase
MLAGRVLGNKYRLVSEMARGQRGALWRAEHVLLRVPVAVKFMSAAAAAEENTSAAQRTEAMKRFLSEARIAAAARGPHVVRVFDYGVDHGASYLVMELLVGETLAQRLRSERCIPARETGLIVCQLARALERVHELGIVHRDLKPDNIFLVEGREPNATILDFGVAHVSNTAPLTTLTPGTCGGDLVGTPNYMSPEQLQDPHSADPRSDVWALGVIAFECLLGRVPFMANHFMELIVAICSRPLPIPALIGPVPRGFDAWFARACARDLERRFPTAMEAAAALHALCEPREVAPARADAAAWATANARQPAAEPVSEGTPAGLKRIISGFFRRPGASAVAQRAAKRRLR